MRYDNKRENWEFNYSIGSGVLALVELAGLDLHEVNTNYKAGVKTYCDENQRKLVEMFNNIPSKIGYSTPPVSYGHVSCLGMDLEYPEGNGEVHYVLQDKSLDEWIKILKKPLEISKEGHRLLEYRDNMKASLKADYVYWSFGYEGPLTTAYELLDERVFYDMYDEPEKFKEFMYALTDNTLRYMKKINKMNNRVVGINDGSYMCDDIASMVPDHLWDELVLPYWNQFYKGMSNGTRFLHAEDLNYKQVKYLEKAQINLFDPSISPKLTPTLISNNSRVPYKWRLGSFHYRDMSTDDIRDWIFKAVSDGASEVFTHVTNNLLNNVGIKKITAFDESCKSVSELLKKGCSRKEIGTYVSDKNKIRFWDTWPE